MMMDKDNKSQFSFRRFLILLTAVLGGLYLTIFYVPRLAGFIFFVIIGAFVLRTSIVALRKGYITINAGTKIATYVRADNPVEFWFYVFFFIIGGILICCFGICFLPDKFNVFRAFFKL